MLFFILAASSSLIAAQNVESDMSAQEKKQTGIYKLNPNEKKSLQDWIDLHYIKRSVPLQKGSQESMLMENLKGGQFIRLHDQSLWEIHPEDIGLTQGWITPVTIQIKRSDDPDYPYKLVNSLSGSSARAKRVKEMPKDGSSNPNPSF